MRCSIPYPDTVKKNRKKHLIVKDEAAACCPQIEANTRTIPGIISQRGCAYAGCKGVVVGPIKDMVTITHGPVGCGYYSWGTRRNKARADDTTPKDKIYSQLCFTTDMQEPDIVFGGEKKLAKMIDEVVAAFHPRAINICATCPVGLIGDDIGAVAKAAEERHGIQVLAYNCEGYKGVSQSAGHHIANNNLMEKIIGTGTERKPGKHVINILGEYNIGGDGWELERILARNRLHGQLRPHRGFELPRHQEPAPRGPQPRPVPPVDQLYRRDDGDQVRHRRG